ncbi:MAG: sigma-54-dependent transcriptional regulator [Nitrospirota bacterium]
MPRILVVEDDPRMRALIKEYLEKDGYSASVAGGLSEAVSQLAAQTFDAVLTDLRIPDGDGMDVLARVHEKDRQIPVIILTAYASVKSAVQAIKIGAYDYLQKPFEPEELMLIVKRATEFRALVDENIRLSAALENCSDDEMVGSSKQILRVKELARKVAPFDSTVLVQGETGTGKEMVARLVHRLSGRAAARFLPVNCGALAETLLEAELFGYEKGAFTGAVRQKAGLFETAGGGTLFLDEINNASEAVQIKLLRVLQDGTILRVGGVEPIRVDVRVIAASNSDLKSDAEQGRFRRDLFYRLNVMAIGIPPLRERPDDIPVLARHFLDTYSRRCAKKITGLHQETWKALTGYQWPGNVRELENAIEHAVIMAAPGQEITPDCLPEDTRASRPQAPLSGGNGALDLERMRISAIKSALETFGGHKTKAAEALGISVPTLWRTLKKLNRE